LGNTQQFKTLEFMVSMSQAVATTCLLTDMKNCTVNSAIVLPQLIQ